MRILKTLNEYGAQTIGASDITLDTKSIKSLGDVISWQLEIKFTSTGSTETYDADSGGWKGTNCTKLFKKIAIKDVNNTDLFISEQADLWHMSYLLSLINVDDFISHRGLNQEPTTRTADVTSVVEHFIVPQPIAVTDLPATFEITLGTLADYFNSAGDGAVTINTLTVVVRYIPPKAEAVTLRVKSFNVQAFSAKTDIGHLLPNKIKIHVLAYIPADITESSAPTEFDETRVDRIAFRRGSNEEIESIRRTQIDNYINKRYDGSRNTDLTVVPTDAFNKSDSTFFEFDVNAQIAPRVYYVYS
jgi:hypothetical protein